jgi:hypothetical protein
VRHLRHLTCAVFLLTALAWVGHESAGVMARSNDICDDVCDGSSGVTCDTRCFATEIDFENGNPTTCGEYGATCCGDGICDTGVEMDVCPDDCGSTDPGVCDQCDPVAQTGCDSGDVCNVQACCVPVPAGNGPSNPVPPRSSVCWDYECNSNADCCAGDKCYLWPSGLDDGYLGTCIEQIYVSGHHETQ